MNTKKCTRCNCLKDTSEFYPSKNKEGYKKTCIKCLNYYSQNHYVNNKEKYLNNNSKRRLNIREFIERVKKISKCKCGESRHWVLDFHHLNDKKFNIAKMSSYGCSISAIKVEMRKCVILCANCHRDLHYKEKINIPKLSRG